MQMQMKPRLTQEELEHWSLVYLMRGFHQRAPYQSGEKGETALFNQISQETQTLVDMVGTDIYNYLNKLERGQS